MGNLDFDVDAVDPIGEREIVEPGRYLAEIRNSEVKANSKGTGTVLKLEFELIDSGARVFTSLNIDHESEKAQKIGRGQLSSLCRALGKVGIVSDSTMLHDRPLMINVKLEETEAYGKQNRITGFYPAEFGKPKAATTESEDEDDVPF